MDDGWRTQGVFTSTTNVIDFCMEKTAKNRYVGKHVHVTAKQAGKHKALKRGEQQCFGVSQTTHCL